MFCIYANRAQEGRLADAAIAGTWECELAAGVRAWWASVPRDLVIFGCRGPNARTPPGKWSSATLRRVVVAQVVGSVATSPHSARLDFEVFIDTTEITGDQLGDDIMESLRLSADNRGRPTRTAYWPAVAYLARLTQHPRDRDLDPIQSLVAMVTRPQADHGRQDTESSRHRDRPTPQTDGSSDTRSCI